MHVPIVPPLYLMHPATSRLPLISRFPSIVVGGFVVVVDVEVVEELVVDDVVVEVVVDVLVDDVVEDVLVVEGTVEVLDEVVVVLVVVTIVVVVVEGGLPEYTYLKLLRLIFC